MWVVGTKAATQTHGVCVSVFECVYMWICASNDEIVVVGVML